MSRPTFEQINEALGATDDMGNNSIEVLRDAARAYLHTLSGYAERDVGALLERLRTAPEPLDGLRVAKALQERLPDDLDHVAEGGLLDEVVSLCHGIAAVYEAEVDGEPTERKKPKVPVMRARSEVVPIGDETRAGS